MHKHGTSCMFMQVGVGTGCYGYKLLQGSPIRDLGLESFSLVFQNSRPPPATNSEPALSSSFALSRNAVMAATDEVEGQDAKRIVKTFSWKSYASDPENDLAKSLVTAEACTDLSNPNEPLLSEQWVQLFDRNVERTLQWDIPALAWR